MLVWYLGWGKDDNIQTRFARISYMVLSFRKRCILVKWELMCSMNILCPSLSILPHQRPKTSIRIRHRLPISLRILFPVPTNPTMPMEQRLVLSNNPKDPTTDVWIHVWDSVRDPGARQIYCVSACWDCLSSSMDPAIYRLTNPPWIPLGATTLGVISL